MALTHLSAEVALDAPAALVWQILAAYDRVHEWAPGVVRSPIVGTPGEGVGAVRRCEFADGGYIVEEITEWDEGTSLTYAITDTSQPIKTGSATWSLRTASGRTVVRFAVQYTLKYGPVGAMLNALMAKRRFQKLLDDAVAALKDQVDVRLGAEPSVAAS